jgi:hypothetical protein
VNLNHLKQYKSENFSPEFDKILGRDICGEGRDAVATKWFVSGTNLCAVVASGCGEDQGIGVAVNGSRRWSSKVARRRGLVDALSPMRRGQVEDDHVLFFNYQSGMVALDRFWSWARLAPGPVLGCGGQVSYFSFFSVSIFSIFCLAILYFLI